MSDGDDGMDWAILPANTRRHLLLRPRSGRFIAVQWKARLSRRNLVRVGRLRERRHGGLYATSCIFCSENGLLAKFGLEFCGMIL